MYDNILPGKKSIIACIEVAGNSTEATAYLVDRFAAKTRAFAKKPEVKDLLQSLQEHAENVYAQQRNRERCWEGVSDTRTPSEIKIVTAVETIKETAKPIIMDFALSESSQLLRGFLVDNNPLDLNNDEDRAMMKKLDRLFHDWMLENHIMTQGGVVYECETQRLDGKLTNVLNEKKPKIAFDNNGKPIRANPAKILQLLTGNQHSNSFAKYLDKRGVSNMKTREQQYPVQAKAAAVEMPKVEIETASTPTEPGGAAPAA